MTTTRYFIAVNADSTNRFTIDGIGNTAEEAIAAAADNAGEEPSAFVAQECTKDLFDLVEDRGGAVNWTTNVWGYEDIENNLHSALVAAAAEFKDEFEGEEPDVLYAQLSKSDGWTARFSTREDREMEMTRWSTGDDVTKLFHDTRAEDSDAIADYAGEIVAGWEPEWTDA